MTDPAAEAARSAAVILTPDLGRNLPAEVEAPLAPGPATTGRTESRPASPVPEEVHYPVPGVGQCL